MKPIRENKVRVMGCLPTNLEEPINKSKLTKSTVLCTLNLPNYNGPLLTCLYIIKDEYRTMAASEDDETPPYC